MTIADRLARAETALAKLKQSPTTASVLLHVLERKHAGDLFVAECKDGPTHTASHRRLDAWVMLRTWSPITMIGYEIKVARSDWLNDKKLTAYLPLCHYLYIIAPKGLVHPGELPAGLGLLEPVGDGTRLVIRQKAVWRDIQLPGDLLVYVLMCRTRIIQSQEQQELSHWRTVTLRAWIDNKTARHELSYAVNTKIRQLFADQETRLQALNRRVQELEQIERRIRELGFDPTVHVDTWVVGERVKQMRGVIDPHMLRDLQQAERALKEARERLQNLVRPAAG